MKLFRLIVLFLFIPMFAFELTYIDSLSGQRRDGSKIYDISFEVSELETGDSISIDVMAFTVSGESLAVVSFLPSSDTGIIVDDGIGQIHWNIGVDHPGREFYSDSVYIRLFARKKALDYFSCYEGSFCVTSSDVSDKIPVAAGQTEEGFFIAMSRRRSGSNAHIAIAEYDSTGIYDESFLFATENEISNPYVLRDSIGDYFFSGVTTSDSILSRRILFAKVDPEPSLDFAYTFYDSANPHAEILALDMAFGDTGDIYISGQYSPFADSANSLFLMKTDILGNVLWSFVLGSIADEEYGRIAFSEVDNAIYISGFTTGFYGDRIGCFVSKIDSSGRLLWSQNIHGTEHLFSEDICPKPSGGCVYLANMPSENTILVINFSSDGETIWSRGIGGDHLIDPLRIEHFQPETYGITGYARPSFDIEDHAFFLLLDSLGDFVWKRLYNFDYSNTKGRIISQNRNNSFLAISEYSSIPPTQSNILIKKSSQIPTGYFCCMYEPYIPIFDIAVEINEIMPSLVHKNMIRASIDAEISNIDFYGIVLCREE